MGLQPTNRIAELRKARRLTLALLSEASGFSVSYLHKIERGDRPLKPHDMKRIAEALNVPPADLLLPEDGGLEPGERGMVLAYRDLPHHLQQAVEDFLGRIAGPANDQADDMGKSATR